jgi:protoporphyrinogen oxidase
MALSSTKMHVGIIGGGIAGLVAGYELCKAGAQVTILECRQRVGGLASSFMVGAGQRIERYYHFICRPDKSYIDVLRELGLVSQLRWKTTKMGLFHNGVMSPFSDPLSLLTFPHLPIRDKIRFAWSTVKLKAGNAASWKALEDIQAQEWLVETYGQRVYDMLYGPLLNLKFREYAHEISAAWMWARFHRLGNSRTITQRECLGYLEGGTQVYIDALVHILREQGAVLRTSKTVERIAIDGERAMGVRCGGELLQFDYLLSTVPTPDLMQLLANARGFRFGNLHQLQYLDVLVLVLQLRHRFSEYFWMNVSDPGIDLAGLIEYTNLNPCPQLNGHAILYLPQYLPASHPLYSMHDEDLFDLHCQYLHKINPAFDPAWVVGYWVHRNRFAQPICDLGFSKHIPSIQSPVKGLYMTDSYQLHPDDRTISGSTHLGQEAARLILLEARSK